MALRVRCAVVNCKLPEQHIRAPGKLQGSTACFLGVTTTTSGRRPRFAANASSGAGLLGAPSLYLDLIQPEVTITYLESRKRLAIGIGRTVLHVPRLNIEHILPLVPTICMLSS